MADRLVRLTLPKPPPPPLVDSSWTLDATSGAVTWSGERRPSVLSDSVQQNTHAADAQQAAAVGATKEDGA